MNGLSTSVRQAVLSRDGGRCVRCGSDELLQIDHRRPTYMGGLDEIDNLQTLCRSCHRKKTSEDAADPRYNAELRRRIEQGRGRRSGFPRGWLVLIIIVLTIVAICDGGVAIGAFAH